MRCVAPGRRRRCAASWQAAYVAGPPVSFSSGRATERAGSSPRSTAQTVQRIVGKSSELVISSLQRNSAQAPSGV
jgi:hypothetical protein